MTKKHVSLLVVFVLLFTTLFTGMVFAADETEWVVADDITITAKAHVQSLGDMEPVTGKGQVAFGTEGKAKRLEKFEITLEGAPADMELVGMAHVQSYGDMPKTGFQAGAIGTSGEAKRIEGVAFKLVKKGTDTLYPGYRVAYAVHMQSFGWGISDKVNEVVGKNFDGAEDFAYDGQFAGTRGLYKRIESVSLIIYKEAKFAINSISAENLKEIEIEFSRPVDEDSATDLDNYSTNAGAIGNITLSEDGKVAVLTLANGVTMTNQTEYKVSILNVKSADKSKSITLKDQKFTVLENQLPEVVDVKALGTKAIKVYVSEPVRNITASMFKLDDKSFFGSVDVDGRVITLKPYNASAVLTVGKHSLTTAKLEDFYGLKSLEQVTEFTVVEDKNAPVIVDITAYLETATLLFDEDIDPATVSRTDFYWKSGSIKKYPDTATASGNKIVLDFTGNPLPAYETVLYVSGISDYNGNTLSDAEITIAATVDQTRPEVVDVKVADDNKSISVKFSKNVSAGSKTYYELKDKDGKKISILNVTGSGKEYVVSLYSALPEGVNTLTISGVADTTALKNVMLPYTTELEVGDTSRPTITAISANGRQIVINFSEVMDLDSIADPNNYLIEFEGAFRKLPAGTELTPIQGGKALLVVLPEKIGSTSVNVGAANNVTKIQVMGVVDTSDNTLNPYVDIRSLAGVVGPASVTAYSSTGSESAILADETTVKVRFDQPIGVAAPSDFTVTGLPSGVTLASVDVDGTDIVVLNFSDSVGTTPAFTLAVKSGNAMRTVTGNSVNASSTVSVADKVAPKVKEASSGTTYLHLDQNPTTATIDLPFTENLSGTATNYALDLVVTRLSDNKQLVALTDYTTTLVNGNTIKISLDSGILADSKYAVSVKEGAQYIVDVNGNKAAESDTYETDGLVDVSVAAPSVVVDNIKATTVDVKVTSNESGTAYILIQQESEPAPANASAVKSGETGDVTANTEYVFNGSALTAGTDYKVYVVVEDSLGNLSPITEVEFTTGS